MNILIVDYFSIFLKTQVLFSSYGALVKGLNYSGCAKKKIAVIYVLCQLVEKNLHFMK